MGPERREALGVSIVCEFQGERLSGMAYFLDRESARAAAEAD